MKIIIILLTIFASNQAIAKEVPNPTRGKDPIKTDKTDPHSFKYNIVLNTLDFFSGQYGANFNVAINQKMTLGIAGTYIYYPLRASGQTGSTEGTGYTVSARLNYYLSGPRLKDGWYVSPVFGIQSTTEGGVIPRSDFGYRYSAIGGYHWVYSSGINIMLGGGITYTTMGGSMDRNAVIFSTGNLQPYIEANLGFAL